MSAALKNMIRRVEFGDGEKNLALRRQFNQRVRAARQLTGGARGEAYIIVYYDPNNVKKIHRTRYEGGIRYYEDIPHDWGTMTYSNGYQLTGMFVDGSREGPFICVDDDGDESEVCFENDKYTEKKTCAPTHLGHAVRMGTIVYKPEKSKECRNLCEDGTKSEKKKYCNRNSPPYPANVENCWNKHTRGNDNQWYESRKNKKGVYTWKKISS